MYLDKLTDLLFNRTKTEFDAYQSMSDGYTDTERETQRQRFMSLWQVIEEAHLEDLYQEWKEQNEG